MMAPLQLFWWRPYSGTLRQRVLDSWNFRPRWGQQTLRIRNFGDELSPEIVGAARSDPDGVVWVDCHRADVVALGSVLLRVLDVNRRQQRIVGSGLPGPIPPKLAGLRLRGDYQLVRGHLTREELRLPSWVPVGDPALALGHLLPKPSVSTSQPLAVLHYSALWTTEGKRMVQECDELGLRRIFSSARTGDVLGAIATASFVVSSSLHGLICADAWGVPAAPMLSPRGWPDFRFSDYFTTIEDRLEHYPLSQVIADPEGAARSRHARVKDAVEMASNAVSTVLQSALK